MHSNLLSDSFTVNQREISDHGSGVPRSSAASAWRDGQAELSTTRRFTYVIVVHAAVIAGLGVDQLVHGRLADMPTLRYENTTRQRVKHSSPDPQTTAWEHCSTTSTARGWRTRRGHPATSASVVGVWARITTWRDGAVAWTLLHVAVTCLSTSCCNFFSVNGSSSRCRHGYCRKARCIVSNDDGIRTTTTTTIWTHRATTTNASVARHSASCVPVGARSVHDAVNCAGLRHSELDWYVSLAFSESEHK